MPKSALKRPFPKVNFKNSIIIVMGLEKKSITSAAFMTTCLLKDNVRRYSAFFKLEYLVKSVKMLVEK